MPRVPTYDNFQVDSNTQPMVAVQSPEFQNFAAQQAKEQGQAMQQLGGEVGRIALDMQETANQSRYNDATNQIVEARQALDLEYSQLRGKEALDQPDGKALWDSYGERYDKVVEEISKNLGNDRQREMVKDFAAQDRGAFTGRIMRHVAKEQQDYNISVRDGTIEVARNQVGLSWGDVEQVQGANDATKVAVYEKGKLQGLSGREIQANLITELSKNHAVVVSSAIDAGQVEYAKDYLEAHDDELTPAMRLQLHKVVKTGDLLEQGQKDADRIMAMQTSDTGRLVEARKISDPERRKEAVTQVKNRINENKALEAESRRESRSKAYSLIANNEKVPTTLWASLDGETQMAIRKLEVNGSPKQDDMEVYYKLKTMPRDGFNDVNLLRYAPYLKASTLKSFMDEQAKQESSDFSITTPMSKINAAITALGISNKHKGEFFSKADTWAQQLGHEPSNDEIQQFIDLMQKEVVDDPSAWFDKTSQVSDISVDGVPDKYTPVIVEYLLKHNKTPTASEITKAYTWMVDNGKIN